MNDYQILVDLIEKNHLEIRTKDCYDSQSGWRGKEIWIFDPESSEKIFDLSGNGYRFSDSSVPKGIEEVKRYLETKNLKSFKDFEKWVEKHSHPLC